MERSILCSRRGTVNPNLNSRCSHPVEASVSGHRTVLVCPWLSLEVRQVDVTGRASVGCVGRERCRLVNRLPSAVTVDSLPRKSGREGLAAIRVKEETQLWMIPPEIADSYRWDNELTAYS